MKLCWKNFERRSPTSTFKKRGHKWRKDVHFLPNFHAKQVTFLNPAPIKYSRLDIDTKRYCKIVSFMSNNCSINKKMRCTINCHSLLVNATVNEDNSKNLMNYIPFPTHFQFHYNFTLNLRALNNLFMKSLI